MMKKILIAMFLIFSILIVKAETDNVDFTKMTYLKCSSELSLHNVTGGSNSSSALVEYFFIDEPNQQIYTENEEPVNNIIIFNDKEIKFNLNFNNNDRQVNKKYRIDRYTGRIYQEGTVRHNNGFIGWLTYAAVDVSGQGTCTPIEKGKKF